MATSRLSFAPYLRQCLAQAKKYAANEHQEAMIDGYVESYVRVNIRETPI